mmetsp:Transcript_1074/g.4524  ORF Transcript_1074/g.4524 Transcript_1074/m.4524 type:complete len:200 (+) Transcript_1074:485-1084(+)
MRGARFAPKRGLRHHQVREGDPQRPRVRHQARRAPRDHRVQQQQEPSRRYRVLRVPAHAVPGHARVQSGWLVLRQIVQDARPPQLRPGHQELRHVRTHRPRFVRRHRQHARVVRQGARAHRREGRAVRPARPRDPAVPHGRRVHVCQGFLRAGQVRRGARELGQRGERRHGGVHDRPRAVGAQPRSVRAALREDGPDRG